jgi:hypothetical protein
MNRRLLDMYAQKWNTEVEANSQCTTYRVYKDLLTPESYLTMLNPFDRIRMCKFRCGIHKLSIVTGRYQNIERTVRMCNMCTQQKLGDEFHYLFECPALVTEICKYVKTYYRIRPNTLKINTLFKSANKRDTSHNFAI